MGLTSMLKNTQPRPAGAGGGRGSRHTTPLLTVKTVRRTENCIRRERTHRHTRAENKTSTLYRHAPSPDPPPDNPVPFARQETLCRS